jgi:hypothetical protein
MGRLLCTTLPSDPVVVMASSPSGIDGRTLEHCPDNAIGDILTCAPDCVAVIVAGHVPKMPSKAYKIATEPA